MNEPNSISPSPPSLSAPATTAGPSSGRYAFIEALAETGIVEEACRRVGMSRTAADNLRRRACGAPFRRAWEAALDYSLYRIEEDAFTRSRRGVARPIFHKGEQVGEWRHYDERLTMFLLRSYRPDRYGKARDRLLAPECDEFGEEYAPEDPGIVLEGGLTRNRVRRQRRPSRRKRR